MATDLILACHGQSVKRDGDRVLGWWADVSLSRRGARQALLLGQRLCEAFEVSSLYTSPLRRARETAELVGHLIKVVPVVKQGLRELDSGLLASLSYEEAQDRFPNLIADGNVGAETRLPAGESFADLHRRAAHTLNRIVDRHPEEQVVAITHGGPIVAFLEAFLGFAWDAPGKPQFFCDMISVHHLRVEAGGEKAVVRLNDTSHLAGMPGGWEA